MSVLTPKALEGMSLDQLAKLEGEILSWEKEDRKENAILYYQPVSERAKAIHACTAKTVGIFGGNRSGKTTTPLVEAVCLATGTIPPSLSDCQAFLGKFRGPIQIRIVCESITTTLHQVMLRKLKWWVWNGFGRPGSMQGHYGWVPKDCLIDGSWESSWSEKLRTLRLLYRDPERRSVIEGESSIQFMSKDQDVSDHASGEFHLIIMDEPPSYAIFQESVARVMSLGGRLFVDMTWPSDPAFPVEWIFDEIYDKGQPGPNKDPNIECFNLYTTENPNVDQTEINLRASQMSDTEKQVRIYGQPIRFSNRIHPLFTDQAQHWCFFCGKVVLVEAGRCLSCQGQEIVSFSHVEAFEYKPTWPVICLLDPHPRKPHMLAYWAVDPHDDLWCVGELEVSESPLEVKKRCDDFENDHHLLVAQRWMDPNMGRSPSGTTREITWQDEFGAVGLEFDLADDSEVGRSRVNEYLKPSPATLRPRMIWHPRCTTGIIQFKRFVWDDYRKSEERDQKQRPKPKHDDFPALARYLLNTEPCFRYLKGGYGSVKMCQDGPGRKGY